MAAEIGVGPGLAPVFVGARIGGDCGQGGKREQGKDGDEAHGSAAFLRDGCGEYGVSSPARQG